VFVCVFVCLFVLLYNFCFSSRVSVQQKKTKTKMCTRDHTRQGAQGVALRGSEKASEPATFIVCRQKLRIGLHLCRLKRNLAVKQRLGVVGDEVGEAKRVIRRGRRRRTGRARREIQGGVEGVGFFAVFWRVREVDFCGFFSRAARIPRTDLCGFEAVLT
jgi:hypothetical protein